MRFKKTLAAGIAAAALCAPGLANAGIDFVYDWGATTQGFIGTSVSAPVRELKMTIESVIVFDGVPFATGTTFTDYVVLRIDQLNSPLGNALLQYGAGNSMEMTILAVFRGIQTNFPAGQNNYAITGVNSFQWYYDGPTGGFTQASFGNLATFTDGQVVQGASSAVGNGTNAVNAPDGNTELTVGLTDLVSPGNFELLASNPGPNVFDAFANSNNHLCNVAGQTCFSSRAAILAAFGQADVTDGRAFFTRSDGSIEKELPEPGTLALIGLGLMGLGFVGRRRNV